MSARHNQNSTNNLDDSGDGRNNHDNDNSNDNDNDDNDPNENASIRNQQDEEEEDATISTAECSVGTGTSSPQVTGGVIPRSNLTANNDENAPSGATSTVARLPSAARAPPPPTSTQLRSTSPGRHTSRAERLQRKRQAMEQQRQQQQQQQQQQQLRNSDNSDGATTATLQQASGLERNVSSSSMLSNTSLTLAQAMGSAQAPPASVASTGNDSTSTFGSVRTHQRRRGNKTIPPNPNRASEASSPTTATTTTNNNSTNNDNSSPSLLLEPSSAMMDNNDSNTNNISEDAADAMVGRTVVSVDDRHLTRITPATIHHRSNSLGTLSDFGGLPTNSSHSHGRAQAGEEATRDEEAGSRRNNSSDEEDDDDDEFGNGPPMTHHMPGAPFQHPMHIPYDQPGAFPARGRAFGDTPSWARASPRPIRVASTERVGALISMTQWLSRRRLPGRADSSASGNSRVTDGSGPRLAEANLVHDGVTVVEASDVVLDGVNEEDNKRIKRWFMCVSAFLMAAIIGLVVGLSIELNPSGGDDDNNNNIPGNGNITDLGNPLCRKPKEELDVFTLCECFNTTEGLLLTDHERDQYALLNFGFLFSNVTDKFYSITDCALQNQVLIATANYERLGLTEAEVALADELIIYQRYALIYFYRATHGDSWARQDGWMQDSLVCDWYGVSCNYIERVSEIRLPYNNIRGNIPTELAAMPFLREYERYSCASREGERKRELCALVELFVWRQVIHCDFTG